MRFEPWEYQKRAIQWVVDKPRCCLFMDMGLGKSVCALTAILRLIDSCEVAKALVIAPKKVAEATWTSEAAKWDHLAPLRVAKAMGTASQRAAALKADADVYVVGRDSFVWLCKHFGGKLPFDMIVIDELTSFKSPKSQRFKAFRACASATERVVGLTGTPAPNGFIDLWAQMYCIDRGFRLGKSVSAYRAKNFNCRTWNNVIVKCELKKGHKQVIEKRISDICLTMQARDYLEMPDLIEVPALVDLPPDVMARYKEFEREKVLECKAEIEKKGKSILATSAAALMAKLSQFANGAVYDADGEAHEVHGEKLERLAEIVEAASGGVLVFYQYRHDIPRIAARLKGKAVKVYEGAADLEEWNAGRIDVLLAHPASTAYGLNMQQGGHYIAWFGTGWNLELYQQANARLHRQGQQHPVTVYKLICRGTVDETMDAAISSKRGLQQSLIDSLQALIEKHG